MKFNEEQLLKQFLLASNDSHSWKAKFSAISIGCNEICFNEKHLLKANYSISFKIRRFDICISNEQINGSDRRSKCHLC